MNKFIKDTCFEHGEHSIKRWYAFILGIMSLLDGLVLMVKSWSNKYEVDTIDIEVFWTLFGAWGITIGGTMVNKLKQFRTSTNDKEPKKDQS